MLSSSNGNLALYILMQLLKIEYVHEVLVQFRQYTIVNMLDMTARYLHINASVFRFVHL